MTKIAPRGPALRQNPLDLSFWSFLTFFAPWYRRRREASSVKISRKYSKEKLVKYPLYFVCILYSTLCIILIMHALKFPLQSRECLDKDNIHLCAVFLELNRLSISLSLKHVPPKLLACMRFLYKVVHKNGRLRKFNRSREIEFNFFTAWNLYETWHTCSSCSQLQNFAWNFLIFVWGLSYGLSKSKKRGKIITKLWKIITKSLAKIKKSEATFCRSALLLSFCENRLCLSQSIKRLNSTERGALFWHFCVSQVITTAHAHKSGVIFLFFSRAFKPKKIKLYDQRWLKQPQGGGAALKEGRNTKGGIVCTTCIGKCVVLNNFGFCSKKEEVLHSKLRVTAGRGLIRPTTTFW